MRRRLMTALAIAALVVAVLVTVVSSGNSTSKLEPNRYAALPSPPSCSFGYTSDKATSRCSRRTFTVQLGPGNTLSEIAEVFGDASRWGELCVTRFHGNVVVVSFPEYIDPLKLLPGSTVAICP